MNEDRVPLAIDIRPADESVIDRLQRQFSPNNALNNHRLRLEVQQRGEGIYLIAWHLDQPVGHLLLRWQGPIDDPTYRFPPQTPYLEAGATLPAFQRRGVATRMIQTAEHLARNSRYQRIGLAVGSVDNPAARRLYERLGYRDWGGGEFTIRWEYRTPDGKQGFESEVCVYMLKAL